MVCSRIILGFIVSKERKTHDPKKIEALVKMLVPKTLQEIQVSNGMAQFYKCFIRNFAFVMAPITKLLRKSKVFEWTAKCQTTWKKSRTSTFKLLYLSVLTGNWNFMFTLMHLN